MAITPTYPGVYVQEAPSGTRTIIGVSTAVTAFIGFFRKGPLNRPVMIFNMGDFEREFGGLDVRSEAAYGIRQYFANDGDIAWVVRTAAQDSTHPIAAAQITVLDAPQGSAMLTIAASSAGRWGNAIKVDVDYSTADPTSTFNLTATEWGSSGGRLAALNVTRAQNLSMNPGAPNYAVAVLAQTSGTLVELVDLAQGTPGRPAQTGTTGGDLGAPERQPFLCTER